MAKKIIKANAKCATFNITMTATIDSTTLTKEELTNVQRKFRQGVQNTVSKLPFAHVYPHEVHVL